MALIKSSIYDFLEGLYLYSLEQKHSRAVAVKSVEEKTRVSMAVLKRPSFTLEVSQLSTKLDLLGEPEPPSAFVSCPTDHSLIPSSHLLGKLRDDKGR